jgi:hypothetical protein
MSTPSNTYDLEVIMGGSYGSQFIGFVEPAPFSEISMTRTTDPGASEFVFFNTFQFGKVPEPASFILLAVGALALRRR